MCMCGLMVVLVRDVLGGKISEWSLVALQVGTLLMKKGVEHGLTLYDIGSISKCVDWKRGLKLIV